MRILLRSEPQGAEGDKQRRVWCVCGVLWLLHDQMEGPAEHGVDVLIGRLSWKCQECWIRAPRFCKPLPAAVSVLCVYECETEQTVKPPNHHPKVGQ
jgi:hypothetical protein